MPFLRLRELFGVKTPARALSEGGHRRRPASQRVGLVVDQIIGNNQTVIKSLSKLHAKLQTFSGATILGDGTVALILDVVHLVNFGQAYEQRLRSGNRREGRMTVAREAAQESMKALTLRLQGEIFAIEAECVREILDIVPITGGAERIGFRAGLINVRGGASFRSPICG